MPHSSTSDFAPPAAPPAAFAPELPAPWRRFRGLAPFLRMSIAGEDLRPLAQALLAQVDRSPDDATLWLNLSLVMQCLEQHDLGLAMQAQALQLQRVYRIAATCAPPTRRLLMLMVPGDLAANTPLDCLLEESDIELIFYYLGSAEQPFVAPIPAHDAVLVALGDSDANAPLLAALEQALAHWGRPVLNAPALIPATRRDRLSALLQGAPGVSMPAIVQVQRSKLAEVAAQRAQAATLFADCAFPLIVRPVGSQAGRDLARVTQPRELAEYLARVPEPAFFVAPFIDYRSADGLYRKFRIAMVDGRPYVSHMAASAHWMVHYVNAGMYEDAAKRAEEARFMDDFDAFCARHQAAFAAIQERLALDYYCMDAAQAADGRLLIFEIDHIMVVHAMDSEALFPFKQRHMARLRTAVRDLLLRRTGAQPGAALSAPPDSSVPPSQP
ncbi:ATP-grasp domain-containing protein [Extensimonas vulgaris]|nr:hypothetical protein [Extensimonas vulgaris]